MSRTWRWVLLVVILVVALVLGGPYLYARFTAGSTPPPLGLQTPGESATMTTAPAPGPLEVDGAWMVGAGSEAGYRVDEVVSGKAGTVVGRTPAVTGDVTVTGGLMEGAEFVVDTASIVTGSTARDAMFRQLLEVDLYPQAFFTLTDPVDLSRLEASGGPASYQADGTLTIRDTTQPVMVELEAQGSGNDVQVSGAIPVDFLDYGVKAPSLGTIEVADSGTVEMLLNLQRAA